MKKFVVTGSIALCLLPFSLCCAAQVKDAQPAAHPFRWIEGCWTTTDGVTKEVWAREGDKHLFGYSTLTKEDEVRFFEQLRLEDAEDGWQFSAYPRGVGPVHFKITASTDTSATFENFENNYPQRIEYRRSGDDLTAEISSADRTKTSDWAFTKCDRDE